MTRPLLMTPKFCLAIEAQAQAALEGMLRDGHYSVAADGTLTLRTYMPGGGDPADDEEWLAAAQDLIDDKTAHFPFRVRLLTIEDTLANATGAAQ